MGYGLDSREVHTGSEVDQDASRMIPKALSHGIKHAEREAVHSSQSGIDVKNGRSHKLTKPKLPATHYLLGYER
jgi:hypothetical protein